MNKIVRRKVDKLTVSPPPSRSGPDVVDEIAGVSVVVEGVEEEGALEDGRAIGRLILGSDIPIKWAQAPSSIGTGRLAGVVVYWSDMVTEPQSTLRLER